MESNDYAKRIRDIKNEILGEIRKLIPEDSAHSFEDTFYVHYVEGEVATTEICHAVEVWHGGVVVFIVSEPNLTENVVEGDKVYQYDSNSFLDILDHLNKDIREKKLDIIRKLLKENGGSIDIKDKYEFLCADEGDKNTLSHSYLKGVEIDGEKILVKTIWKEDGERYDYHEHCITNDELNGIIDCLRKNTYREFVVRVSGSFSRTFDINASSYEEALALAKKQWEETPLYSGDSNGEDWDDYTDYPH